MLGFVFLGKVALFSSIFLVDQSTGGLGSTYSATFIVVGVPLLILIFGLIFLILGLSIAVPLLWIIGVIFVSLLLIAGIILILVLQGHII